MDRPIVYAGAQPLETDILNLARSAMIGLGRLAMDVLGTSTAVSGLACTPTTVPSMAVAIGAGAIYANLPVDQNAYSSLVANTTDYIMKQGILSASSNLTLAMAAPGTVGQSIIYMVEAEFLETDTNPATLYYYNSANPSVPWVGPSNSGSAQNTTRQDTILVQAKAGVASATPVAPTVDAGFVPLYLVTIPYGATTITSGMISVAPGAPFLSGNLGSLSGYLSASLAALTYAPINNPALTGAPTAPTPAQFDNSNKLATTAFVQRMAGNFAGYTSLSGAQTIGASKAGFYLLNSTTGTATWTLPNATISPGYSLVIENAGTGVLTLTSGGGNFTGPLGSGSTTLNIPVGATIELVADGTAWHCYAGTAGLLLASGFTSSLGSSGYQVLPSGLIIQWGSFFTSGSGYTNLTFPIAWPNGLYQMSATQIGSSTTSIYSPQITMSSATLTTVPVAAVGTDSTLHAVSISYVAIGH